MPDAPANESVPKPAWEVMVRPMAFTHEPWKMVVVGARSPMQADAILRRQGYETLTGSIQRTDDSPHPLTPARPRPVVCSKCGYALAGLTINSAHVQCPECAFEQVLVAWSPEADPEKGLNAWIAFLAVAGFVSLLGVVLSVLVVLLF